MSADLSALGVDTASLVHSDMPDYPPVTPGRVVHIDADFLAYQVSAESKDELQGLQPRRTLEEMKHNALAAVEDIMRKCGGETYVCHVTPSASDKGGRNDQAVQQEYQAARSSKDKPEHLDAIRAYVVSDLNGIAHLDQEADDGLAQANYNATDPMLSVIYSMDKDLRMAPGLHWCFVQNKLIIVERGREFGNLYYDEAKTGKAKITGWGTKFFWAQTLMGDTADGIKGIPGISGKDAMRIKPTVSYTKAVEALAQAEAMNDPEKVERYAAGPRKVIEAAHAKIKPCGPALTWAILRDVKSDKEAFETVRTLWKNLSEVGGYEFTHWKTGQSVTPTQALLGDMKLLWMRRNKNTDDVVDWLKEQL